MKRFILSTALALAMGNMASAQMITGRFDFVNNPNYHFSFSVPKEFSYNGAPRLILSSGIHDDYSFLVYNENIEQVKSIKLNPSTFDYQLTYKVEEREVKSVDEKDRRETHTYNSLDEFIQQESWIDPSFTPAALIYTNQENGDRRVDFDFDKLNNSFGQERFFHKELFGGKYPLLYGIEHDGKFSLYSVSYTVSYTDWVEKGEEVENNSFTVKPLQLGNVNLNNDVTWATEYFYVSQTLFNEDEAYEYLVPKFKMVEASAGGSTGATMSDSSTGSSSLEENMELTRKTLLTKESNVALVGFQVVGENGNILKDLSFEDYIGDRWINDGAVVTIGTNVYLAFYGHDLDGKQATVFYKIDRTTSSIQKVRTVPGGMNLSSTIANKGADIQVNFNDNNEKGSEIIVFSANGAKVKSFKVPAGQKTATFNVNGSAGMYLVNRAQNGKANETKKIVIK